MKDMKYLYDVIKDINKFPPEFKICIDIWKLVYKKELGSLDKRSLKFCQLTSHIIGNGFIFTGRGRIDDPFWMNH